MPRTADVRKDAYVGGMGAPSARLFRLLSLLQARRVSSGAELADRLAVTERTVRRDIECLRELGYPVEGVTGTAGGYRLGSGERLPPLLLEDAEAVAIAAALLSADGLGETAARALAKLEQVLPKRLQPRVGWLAANTVAIPGDTRRRVDAGVLAVLAAACRDREVVEFGYTRMDGATGPRSVAPHHIAAGHGLWYLIAHDRDRDGWRVFRIDRVHDAAPTGRPFTPRALPDEPARYLAQTLAATRYPYTAVARVRAPAEQVRARLRAPLPHRVEALDEASCRVRFGANELDTVLDEVLAIATLGARIELEGPAELHGRLERTAATLGGIRTQDGRSA